MAALSERSGHCFDAWVEAAETDEGETRKKKGRDAPLEIADPEPI